jgi:putative alpha-1,2-mannosidase
LGRKQDANEWSRVGARWGWSYDKASGLPGLLLAEGKWAEPPKPESPVGLIEGSAAQYAWSPSNDLNELITITGGQAAARLRLNRFFSAILGHGWHNEEPFFWAGNEVSLHVPWVWDWLGEPGQARATLSRILDEAWSERRDGWPGNDDSGTLGAWVACALTGLYPVRPGVAGLALHEPFFKTVEIGPQGHPLIAMQAADSRPRWPQPWLNGQALPAAWMDYDPRARVATRVEWKDGAGPLAPPQ